MVTQPIEDPKLAYSPLVPALLKCVNFHLNPYDPPLSEEQRRDVVQQTHDYLIQQQSNFMGFQAGQKMQFSDDLGKFLDMHLNNIGDPFVEGSFSMNTKYVERAILDHYASLWNAKWPSLSDEKDPNGETYWGFLLTMGSTEGNMYALWNARDYLSGKILFLESSPESSMEPAKPARLVYRQATLPKDNPNAFSPVAFYSEDTHYSFAKATRLIGLPLFYEVGKDKYPGQCPLEGDWPTEVPSEGGGSGPGSIDVDKLNTLVEFFASKGHPIFVSFNYGSTFKGAYDNVERAGELLLETLKKYGLDEREIIVQDDDPSKEVKSIRTGYWIHVDGALGAAYMPYLQMARSNGRYTGEVPPNFDFQLPFVHSIAMSGHKWPGAPIPCGVFMSKRKYQMRPPSNPNYTGSGDTTFAGSRNGLSPLFFWNSLAKLSTEDHITKVLRCLNGAQYLEEKLKELEKELQKELWIARTEYALTVRFRKATDQVIRKYSLSNEQLIVDGVRRTYSHVFTLDHVTHQMVDSLVEDLKTLGFDPASEERVVVRSGENPTFDSAALVSFVPSLGRGWR